MNFNQSKEEYNESFVLELISVVYLLSICPITSTEPISANSTYQKTIIIIIL